MRKMTYVTLMLLAVVAAGAGAVPQTEAAQSTCLDPGPNCDCRCECGQLLKCCTYRGTTTCEPTWDPNLLCPQIACI